MQRIILCATILSALFLATKTEAGGKLVKFGKTTVRVPVEDAPVQAEPIPVNAGYAPEYAGGYGHGSGAMYNDSGYGWSPKVLKFLKRAPVDQGFAPPMNPPSGTLAFPNHPFARSPRDFFMTD